ncbi:transcription termination/antitermination protein NusA [Candidatus Dojkabacteria bacterium]|nr:transcription termination/antitermination protein NusA [Candidatus Dojkabacteria bacterium]
MAIQSEFLMAVNQIAAERGIDADEILDAVKHAIKSGFKKDYSEEEGAEISVEIDETDGAVTVFVDKKVVEKVTNKATQISLKKARDLESKLEVGDHVEIDITPEGDFGRVAAQTAKQVIMQKLREAEKESQIQKFLGSIGEIETAIAQRMDGDSVLFELGKATAVMPASERIPNEYYKSGAKYKVLIKDIKDTPRGKTIFVSRADPEFLKALFRLEVPELLSETLEIKSIAREAGQRSKVAVKSNVEGVDPIGSCVGQKGVRIMAIMNELKMGQHEEKIDIILWDEDEEQFVNNALSPAQVIESKILDGENKIIQVIVPDEQLSLAIGKDGQNVRLAAKLTGWNIDIQGETVKVDSDVLEQQKEDREEEANETEENEEVTEKEKEGEEDSIKDLGLTTRIENALESAGINTVEELEEKISKGEKIEGIGKKSLEKIEKALK